MRILDANGSYSSSGGGIRVYHLEKLRYFNGKPGHRAALVIPGPAETLPGTVGRVYGVRSVPLFSSGYGMMAAPGDLEAAVLDFVPDLVEIGSPYVLPHMTRRVLTGTGIPMVGFYHGDFPGSYVGPYARKIFPRRIASFLERLAEKYAGWVYGDMTAVFAASRFALEKLRSYGVTRLFHTPLGVDTARFTPEARSRAFRDALGVPEEGTLVLYMARFHWEKGLDMLLKAYPMFRDPGRIVLAVAGRGPHYRLVKQFAERYPEIRLLGFIGDRDEVAGVMASADVFLALGNYETFGLAALEAVSAGTIPVLSGAGASRELACSLGLLDPFEPGDPESLARTVKRAVFLSRQVPAEVLREYALDGRDWRDVFERMEGFYRRIMEAAATGDVSSLEPEDGWW